MVHTTVLLHESIDGLNLTGKEAVVVDATINGGGHSEEIAKRYGDKVTIIGIDMDADALERAKARLDAVGAKYQLAQSNFRNLDTVLRNRSVDAIDGILFDLGLSSNQFEDSGRGFTFQKDEPLLMTFKKNPEGIEITAGQIVNEWQEENIADVIFGYGEERYARRIAKKIVEARATAPIKTTFQLVEIIRSAVPGFYQHGKTHFATKTFQALRITANDEVQALREGLLKGFGHLKSGGRMSVISFHSIEDRIVKRFFQDMQEQDKAKIITKKPISPSQKELTENRRARSAKLRILERI